MKECRTCKKQKDSDCFYTKKENKDKLSNECKSCTKERVSRNRKKDPSIAVRAQKNYRAKIASQPVASSKKCRICSTVKKRHEFYFNKCHKGGLSNECRECLRKADAEKKKKDPDFYRKKYLKNRNAAILRSRQYRKKNPEKVAKAMAEWRAKNPEIVKYHSLKRRERIANSGAKSATPGEIKSILELQKFKCAECGVSIRKEYHIDHIMPVALGGTSEAANLQGLCKSCNLKKHCKDPIDWANENGRLL